MQVSTSCPQNWFQNNSASFSEHLTLLFLYTVVYICVCVCVCVCVYIYIYIYMYVCMYVAWRL